ncbi:hypothetical protein SPRG_00143 [Saprolegnia parasitica CBS 223.65]|uniref:Uncharacterized protein n=1 Tax=Saprolegnia parasitica (strain CBS 223.65) TaxID=695850 RepID=A0A067CX76_SAPPC|nr:hypothetical protein SPRG_00143 [Saprolegnia parasitica CBS 223.65]KDO35294.1 hypothetical protein SPRG_00143 [Saprolegnia parasitica CBS 223.65]|eukprot:XP_012193641.1 hypothetical protein SPRG_00143 [Saprolegnia parasitica CBS 223.65]
MKRDDAIAYFQGRLEKAPMDEDALHNLSVLYKSKGDTEQYERVARIALLTKRGGPAHYNELGLALMQAGKLDDAYDQLQNAVALQPSFGPAHINLSAVKAKRGHFKEAIRHCEDALKYLPNDPSVHRNMAKLLEAVGRTAESLTHNQAALRLAPPTHPWLGRLPFKA